MFGVFRGLEKGKGLERACGAFWKGKVYMSALMRDWQSRINLQVELRVEKCAKIVRRNQRFVALFSVKVSH